MRYKHIVSGAAAGLAAAMLSAASAALAVAPTLSLSLATGDSVQVTVHGDPNQGVILYYTSTAGPISTGLGMTDASGNFSNAISSGGYAISGASIVHVAVNGQNSPTMTWPYGSASSAATSTASTSQTATGAIGFSQTTVQLSVNGTAVITLSGDSNFYAASTTNQGIVSESINGTSLSVSGLSNGTTTVTICTISGSCGPISVGVGMPALGSSAATSTASSSATPGGVSFSNASPSLGVGQSMNINLSGGSGSYFISSGAAPGIATLSLSGASISVFGVSAGSTSATVCATSGGCGTLAISVTGSGTATPPPSAAAAPAAASPAPQTPAASSPAGQAVSNAQILSQVQSLQSQLLQVLSQIQAMQTSLAALVAKISPAGGASASSGAGQFSAYLSVGSRGADVTALQNRLTAEGAYSGPVTGTFGPLTEQGVKNYQSAHGLAQSGALDAATRAALNK